jgi:integrase
MSPARLDQVIRCGRCQRKVRPGVRRWPEGHICSGCYVTAMETYASCTGCGRRRLTPGRDSSGQPLCPPCAGITVGFTCARCGREALRHTKNTCGHCVLAERLAVLLDDGTGQIRPELVPFHEHLSRMSRPRSGILWIAKPHVPPLLAALARGQVPLTHNGLASLSPWRSVIHVRDLLMACGVLPETDRFLLLFEQWLAGWLAGITDDEHRALLRRFATWHTLRMLRAAAGNGPVGPARNQAARNALTQSAAFLTWLAGSGRTLDQCTQADLDRFFACPGQARNAAIPFLRWCITQQELPRLQIITRPAQPRPPASPQQRLDLIRRLADDSQLDLRDRVVALLILLYAQPVTKIARLTINDVIRDGSSLTIRLGNPPAPVPEPFASLIASYLDARPNLATATNPGSQLLFPGRRAGQPLHPTTLRLRMAAAGIPNITSRTAALRQLLLQAPAPVIAAALGYSATAAGQIAAAAGATWQNYAPGDHSR